LEERNLLALCGRLSSNNMPTGIAALLYGHPGTGKTESVMQIARSTGRDVMHVDISQTKSHWFGDSEKLIKEVFDKYRRLCERSKVKPILLFNEADAVFSKRRDSRSGNLAQTENAIQNIILEEMENLDGILIATTNMANNLDAAFERRFLFKIRFDKPTVESKKYIWMDKLPRLGEAEASQLATTFDFSGGEIDNIVRKALMEEVISGKTPDMERMTTLCREEKMAGRDKGKGVGFK
ncbi:MAG: ATP-binding protein, partial [Bacteroidales bacterium]|nr:ATP-binding protein [Bacteroidales bacterium]